MDPDPSDVNMTVKRAAGGRVEPSDAQKEAGNYKKDHVRICGMNIAIENRAGSERSGIGKDGKRWSVKMPADYGYIKGTEGADGDHVDCYVGPRPLAGYAYIIDQTDADTGRFDEHKVMLGFPSLDAAVSTYAKGFSDGKGLNRVGQVTRIPTVHVLAWAKSGAAKKATDLDPLQAEDPLKRARGGIVKGGGPFGVPTFGQVSGPARKAMSGGLGFADGGAVDLAHRLIGADPVERAMRIIRQGGSA